MAMDWVCQLCRHFKTPETAIHYRNAAIGILSIPVVELFVTPLQLALDRCQVDLPASIVAMLGLLGMMLTVQLLCGGTDTFYRNHVKGPVSFLRPVHPDMPKIARC